MKNSVKNIRTTGYNGACTYQQILEAVTFEVIDAARSRPVGQKLENLGLIFFHQYLYYHCLMFMIVSCKSFGKLPTVLPHIRPSLE